MLAPIRSGARAAVAAAAREKLGADVGSSASSLERPPKIALGDLALPRAFDLAKALRRSAARDRGRARRGASRLPAGVPRGARSRAGGYLNFFLDRGAFVARARCRGAPPPAPARRARSSSSTPASTRTRRPTSATCATPSSATSSCACCAHRGHAWGSRTTSTTPACRSPTWWWAFCTCEKVTTLEDMRRPCGRAASRRTRDPKGFDYFCWDLYAEVGRPTPRDPRRKSLQAEVLHAIEAGDNETAAAGGARRRGASSAATWPPWSASASATTCCRTRATSCACTSGTAPSSCSRRRAPSVSRPRASTPAAGCCASTESPEFAGHGGGTRSSCARTAPSPTPARTSRTSSGSSACSTATSTTRATVRTGTPASVREQDDPGSGARPSALAHGAHGGEPDAPAFGRGDRVYNVIDVGQSYPQRVVPRGPAGPRHTPRREPLDPLLLREGRALAARPRESSPSVSARSTLSAEDEKKPYVKMSGPQGAGRQGRRPRRAPAGAVARRDRRAPQRRRGRRGRGSRRARRSRSARCATSC